MTAFSAKEIAGNSRYLDFIFIATAASAAGEWRRKTKRRMSQQKARQMMTNGIEKAIHDRKLIPVSAFG